MIPLTGWWKSAANNGNVGVLGIYPGFYSTYSLLSNHPALTVSPQLVCWFLLMIFMGAYLLSYWK
jgi:hypothetical protein